MLFYIVASEFLATTNLAAHYMFLLTVVLNPYMFEVPPSLDDIAAGGSDDEECPIPLIQALLLISVASHFFAWGAHSLKALYICGRQPEGIHKKAFLVLCWPFAYAWYLATNFNSCNILMFVRMMPGFAILSSLCMCSWTQTGKRYCASEAKFLICIIFFEVRSNFDFIFL